eukprot:s2040_g7.t1
MDGLTTEFIDSCARELGAKRLRLSMPWNGSQFDFLLNSKPVPLISAPDWVDFPLQLFSQSAAVERPTKLDRHNVRVHLSEVSWVGTEHKKLNLALQCWKVIVLDSTCNTDLGRLLMQSIELGRGDDYIWQVIHDTFCNKSSSTLKSRAASLLAFGRWKKIAVPGELSGIFPISEEMAYDYLCDLRRMKAAPSKGKRFLEAVGFSKGLLGASVEGVLSSARVKGVAHSGQSTVTRKKAPLTVEQLVTLERIATYGQGQDAIFAGYLCFIVHCRLRWSDGQHCIKEPEVDLDQGRGFIEAALYHHKTAQKRRTTVVRLLPVAGVLPGVSGSNWAIHWLHRRAEFGLKASMKQPVMPAPVQGGGWSEHPLSSSEASIWMRELLQPWSSSPVKELATHSAKATVLSWMSKSNVELTLRRLAGYHVTPGDKSALEYSRDAAAPVLRQIEAIFIAVRAQMFKPDERRSKRWCGVQTLEEAVKSVAMKSHVRTCDGSRSFLFNCMDAEHDTGLADIESQPEFSVLQPDSFPEFGDDTTLSELRDHTLRESGALIPDKFETVASDISDASVSDDSETETDSDSDEADRKVEINGERNSRDLVAPSDLADKECFRHRKSRKLHLIGRVQRDVKLFKCGRRCNDNYEILTSVPAFAAHGCMTCFGWSLKPTSDSSD